MLQLRIRIVIRRGCVPSIWREQDLTGGSGGGMRCATKQTTYLYVLLKYRSEHQQEHL